MLPNERPPRTWKAGAALAGFLLVAAAAAPLTYWAEQASLRSWARRNERFTPPAAQRNPFSFPGVETPPARPAGRAALGDDEPVIGVEVGGKARGYHQRSLSGTTRHIINDLLGGKAVTVTYCDLDDCARAFSGGDRATPLDVAQAGLLDGRMLVRVGDVAYFQSSAQVAEHGPDSPAPPFPYAPLLVTRTTWGDWKARHPDTDVYVHDRAAARSEPKRKSSPAP